MELPRPVLIALPVVVFLAIVAFLLVDSPAPEEEPDAATSGEDATPTARSPSVPLEPGDQTAAGPGASRVREGEAVSPPSKARTWRAGARTPLSLPAASPHPAQDNVVSRDSIQAAVNEILPQIKECVEGWMTADPGLEGHVVVEVHLGPEGLMSSAIADHDGVPFGVQTCFASAMVEAPWPAPPDGEFVVRYPFTFFGVEGMEPEQPPAAPAEEPEDSAE